MLSSRYLYHNLYSTLVRANCDSVYVDEDDTGECRLRVYKSCSVCGNKFQIILSRRQHRHLVHATTCGFVLQKTSTIDNKICAYAEWRIFKLKLELHLDLLRFYCPNVHKLLPQKLQCTSTKRVFENMLRFKYPA